MSSLNTDSVFQQAIEAAEQLSVDDRLVLLEVLQQRIQQTRRQELVSEIAAVREEYHSGNVRFGSVDDFMAELDEEV
jgi:tRNA A37 N6-isopentenylltransferase MiaA